MTTATLTNGTATAATTTTPARGLGKLPCPLCGDAEAAVQLDLDDLATCTCRSCGDDFTLDDVRAWLAKWQRVLDWVSLAPAQK